MRHATIHTEQAVSACVRPQATAGFEDAQRRDALLRLGAAIPADVLKQTSGIESVFVTEITRTAVVVVHPDDWAQAIRELSSLRHRVSELEERNDWQAEQIRKLCGPANAYDRLKAYLKDIPT